MKLSIYLPASLDELERFAATCRSLGLLGHYQPVIAGDEMEGYELLGVIDHDDMAAEPAATHAAKAAKRTAQKAPAKKKAASAPGPGGDTAEAIVTALEKVGGRWDGSASAFVKHAGLGHHALNVLPKLAIAGKLRLLKPSPTGRVTAIELVAAPANVTAFPQPPAPRQPAAPATPPPAGLKPPSGGWA